MKSYVPKPAQHPLWQACCLKCVHDKAVKTNTYYQCSLHLWQQIHSARRTGRSVSAVALQLAHGD
eukprot:1155292-Pelagomonas_calceolata.AAC.6